MQIYSLCGKAFIRCKAVSFSFTDCFEFQMNASTIGLWVLFFCYKFYDLEFLEQIENFKPQLSVGGQNAIISS